MLILTIILRINSNNKFLVKIIFFDLKCIYSIIPNFSIEMNRCKFFYLHNEQVVIKKNNNKNKIYIIIFSHTYKNFIHNKHYLNNYYSAIICSII